MTKISIDWEEIHSQLSNELDQQIELLHEGMSHELDTSRYHALRSSVRNIHEILVKQQLLKYINEMIQEDVRKNE